MSRQACLRKAGIFLLSALIFFLVFRLLGPVLLPFLLGYLVAKAADPAIAALQGRTKLPRWAAAGLCVAAIYALLAGTLWFLSLLLYEQFCGFAKGLPALAAQLTAPAERLKNWLLSGARRFPDGIGAALALKIEAFFKNGAGLPARLSQWLFQVVSNLVAKLPSLALFLMTAILSSFMLAAQLTELNAFWKRKAPKTWQQQALALIGRIKATFGGWLHAQLRLMAVNFLVLTAGLFLLKVPYATLFGLLIALLDALPVFGSGAVLIPWGLMQLVRQQTVQGVGLLCLYGAVTLLRTTLEPRMLGKQMGLSPLLTLLALYGGFRLFGIPGMILAPMALMLAKQFWEGAEKQIDN